MSITPEEISIRVGLDAKNAQRGLKGIEKSLKGFGKIGKANNKIFSDFLRLAGFAGLTKMTLDASNFAHSMHILSQQTGLAVDKLSQMRNIWVGFGTDKKAFGSFSQRMASDLSGYFTGAGSTFYSAFTRMGISAFDKGGKIRDIKELFGDVADYMSMQNIPQWAKIGTLGNLLGVPAEVAQYLTEGRDVWYSYLEQEAQRVGNVTDEEVKKNEELNKTFRETMANFDVAIQKTTAALSQYLIPVLEGLSNFAKENPKTATALSWMGTGAKWGGATWLLSKLFTGGVPAVVSGLGTVLAGGAALATGGAVGYGIARGGAYLYDKSVQGEIDRDVNKLKTKEYEHYAEFLKNLYEKGMVDEEELKWMLESNEYGGAFTKALLKEKTKNMPEVFRADGSGYSWQNFWSNQDTTKAIRGGSFIDSHNTINQENHFTINDMTAEDAKEFGIQAATEIYHPLVWKAMTGVG